MATRVTVLTARIEPSGVRPLKRKQARGRRQRQRGTTADFVWIMRGSFRSRQVSHSNFHADSHAGYHAGSNATVDNCR